MKLTAYQYYPLGFRSPIRDGFRTETIPDPAWATLYAEFQSGTVNAESMEFRMRVIAMARRLFGNFNEWLDAQDQNPKISDQAYQLVQDTVTYLNLGRRPVDISCRSGIIADQIRNNRYSNPKAVERRTRLRDQLQVDRSDVLFRWVQPRDGFGDLVQSLNVFFGEPGAR